MQKSDAAATVASADYVSGCYRRTLTRQKLPSR
jgi:hypothetical protein